MKSGVVVVWFNPNAEHVGNLILLLKQHKYICVVDNSVDANTKLIPSSTEINYIHNGNKGGIAGAFNRGFDYFYSENIASYVYTFDQDTKVPDNYFLDMDSFILTNKASIACPSFFDINAKTFGKFVKMKKLTFHESNDKTTHFCISSGMSISIKTYLLLNGFNEDLIIDHVDTEFALKAYTSNISISFNRDVVLEHAIGEREKKNFLGVTIKPNHHSAVRKYYISRNGTYLALKYFNNAKSYFVLNVFRMIHEYLSVILYENQKVDKIKAMNRGLVDAIKGKLGKY